MKRSIILTLLALVFLTMSTGPAFAAPQTFTNSIGMEFTLIPAGSFVMGNDKGILAVRPAHEVTISTSFYMGTFEVTQAQWMVIMGTNPSQVQGPDHPVEQVSWHDAQAFIARLNSLENTNRYRLPTEAEWEYAARAGSTTRWYFGDDAAGLSRVAWFDKNSQDSTRPVGQKDPNAWGLYDMHGNVWEWTQDYWSTDYYSQSPAIDPAGPASGSKRVKRGGSWMWSAGYTRSAYRTGDPEDTRISRLGFRVVLEAEATGITTANYGGKPDYRLP